MGFEELFEKIGERIDETMEGIGKNVDKRKQEVKTKINKSRENMSDEFIKKMNKLGENISPDSKSLSRFEKIIGNIAIGIAHSLEGGYKKITDTLFMSQKECKTKYGLLGKTWCKHVPKERGCACLNYIKIVEKKISSKNKLKKEILKDIVESLGSSSTELYSYYIYGHMIGYKSTKNHEEKKEVVKKYLMSSEDRKFYENDKNEGKTGKIRKGDR